MANKAVHLPVVHGLGQTLRKDNWWAGPFVTFLVLASFVVYATFRAFEGRLYMSGPYLSPLASPYFETASLGIPFVTPAILILPFPGLFRFTCYYYRKAYYRSFAMTPPACAVGGRSPGNYNGERKLLLFQNLHRFALYFALLFLVFLWHDFYKSLWFDGHFGMGLGSLIIGLNCTCLSLYTFSCHSFRHLVGGVIDSYSETPFGALRHKMWSRVSQLNVNHMAFAWTSLIVVAMTDLYIRMVASGAVTDMRLF
ncbi:MAG: hypothetical protein KC657_03840 [Myxococcales bacterium]|nr:hypothetical protein [Myxococcales bacterium]